VNLVFLVVFNIINRRTLLAYCRLYPATATALQQWYIELLNQNFASSNQLKAVYASASLVGDDRVVFNILGNKYRLVVRFVFAYKTIQLKWFGTHREYDQVDVATVQFRPL
jgi:mRNA interferase HigB